MTVRERELQEENLRLHIANRRLQETGEAPERDKLIISLRQKIEEQYNSVLKHYTALDNDLCWKNDDELYESFGLLPKNPAAITKEIFLANCGKYCEGQFNK